ncbi:MAG TPA: ATP-binding cassette domain-containing protein [Phytomonospora sp.]
MASVELRGYGWRHAGRRAQAVTGVDLRIGSGERVLLLDEPTANLDPEGAGQVREALRSVLAASEATMVLVEHRVAEVVDLVDRVVVLGEGGGLLADGPPGRVFAEHGDALTRQGVWVPGAPPVPERKAAGSPGETLVRADAVGRLHPGAAAPSLSDVDMAVAAGELVAVLGANGSGKSTLALMLGGLLRPTSGRVLLTGATAPPHKWRAPALARAVGSVFQNPEQQFVTSRVYDELALGPRRVGYDEAEVARTVGELLERLRLSPLAEANPFTLSGGQARRLSVATALATAPGLLVFDEPTFGQDRRTWTELVELIAGLRDEGRGVLAVTHDRDFTAALADRTVTIHEGRVAC